MQNFERWRLRLQTHQTAPPLQIFGYVPEGRYQVDYGLGVITLSIHFL